VWRIITLGAVLWPSHVSGWLDGAPLDTPAEAVLLGLALPALIWLHPAFLRRRSVRAIVVTIALIKIFAAFGVQQDGWCVTFEPPYPMVRESTGKPHSWDPRADWLADDPACSAIMTRRYADTFELPAWFYNLPPPDDAVVRTGFHPGEIPVRVAGRGYITVGSPGEFALLTTPRMDASLRVDGIRVDASEPGRHQLALRRGSHLVEFDGTMLGKEWRIIPEWRGAALGSMLFPAITTGPPSALDRLSRPAINWLLLIAVATLIAGWLLAAARRLRTPPLLAWSIAASAATALVGVFLPQQAAWYTAAAAVLPVFMPVRARFMNVRGLFFLIVLPWLAFAAGTTLHQAGRWTLYGIGNDNFLFQRFSYRIFMQHFWLEGGQQTFWNQPLFRWIAGVLHLLFGDSSLGQVYWDAAGVAIIMLFAYRTMMPLAGFRWGLIAALVPLTMFLLGPALEFVGFGLSEISSAAFIYLAVFFAMRDRGYRDAIVAGVLVTLGFYTRLNNLPMAISVAAFALPLTLPIGDWWRMARWLPMVRWRVVSAIASGLMIGCALFAWRTWYYTGVFSLFHGTQREFLAVWKPGMSASEAVPAMLSSVMMVLTGQDPPRFALHAAPLVAAGVIAVAGILGIPGFRLAPLPLVALYTAGLSGALLTRGWGHEGRFSIHLYGAAAALCVWGLASVAQAWFNSRNMPQGAWHASPAARPGHPAI
jgi:hypothetical protein